jgi:hypothetical protein
MNLWRDPGFEYHPSDSHANAREFHLRQLRRIRDAVGIQKAEQEQKEREERATRARRVK